MGKLVSQETDNNKNLTENEQSFNSDRPFDIPNSWRWSYLNKLAQINGGFAFKSGNYNSDGTRVVRISDFDEGGFKSDKIVRHTFSSEHEKFKIFEGDILMAMTGGTVGKSLHVTWLRDPILDKKLVSTIRAIENIS